jgi:hypothetical protein
VAGVVEEARILYGLKAAVTNQRGWVPNSAVILQASTPTAGPGNATQGTFTYVFGWNLPNDWQLDSAIRYGVSSEEGDHYNQWAPSVVAEDSRPRALERARRILRDHHRRTGGCGR